MIDKLKMVELLRLTQLALFKPCCLREPYFNAHKVHICVMLGIGDFRIRGNEANKGNITWFQHHLSVYCL